MIENLVPVSVRNMIDAIFSPPLTFLQLMHDNLTRVGTVLGRGINLNNYFGFFAYLPPAWQSVVQSALASVTLLAILFIVRSLWDMYLKIKASSKWW